MPDRPTGPDLGALDRLIFGYRVSQAIAVAASLGIPDAVASRPRSVDDLAVALECHPGALGRLLRTLAAAGVLQEQEDGRFSLTDLGRPLRSDVPGTIREQAILQGRPYVATAWANLEHSIRTGGNAFEAAHGEDVWAWRAARPAEASQFNRTMAAITAAVAPALAGTYDFSAARRVADIGGGSGTLLAAVLRAHPHLHGIDFDQPSVVTEAEPVLRDAGVLERCEIVGGDFFVDVPAADVYVMKAILHDWSDERATQILRTIRRAATPSSRLLIVERVLGGPNEDLLGKLSDLHMLVMPGGLERTRDEWLALLGQGGFELGRIRTLAGPWQLLEAIPA